MSRSTRDPAAYEMFLQGWYHFDHHGAKNLQTAIRFGQRALEIDPHYARAWALIALCEASLRLRGQLQESGLAAAEKALELDPTLALAHVARGRILSDLGRYDEAVGEHKEALRLDPDSYEAAFNFGLTCKHFGNYEAAVEHFEHATRLAADDYGAWGNLAQVYEAVGIRVHRVSTESLNLPLLNDVDVGTCTMGNTTAEPASSIASGIIAWATRANTAPPAIASHSNAGSASELTRKALPMPAAIKPATRTVDQRPKMVRGR